MVIPEGAEQLPQIACSLDSGDFAERGAFVKQTFDRWLVSQTRSDRTLHLRFADDAEAETSLKELIRLESQCCPFFSFDLRKADGSLFLSIGVPEGAEPTLDAFTTFSST